jgi:hypothetical protein
MTKEEIQSKLQAIKNNNALPEKQKGMLIDKYEKMLGDLTPAALPKPKAEKKTTEPKLKAQKDPATGETFYPVSYEYFDRVWKSKKNPYNEIALTIGWDVFSYDEFKDLGNGDFEKGLREYLSRIPGASLDFQPDQDGTIYRIVFKDSKTTSKKPAKTTAETDYDCDDLIEEAKERKAKALAAYEKRKNAPKKSAATKSKDAVIRAEKSVEKGVKKGDISVSEIEKIIDEYEDAIKKLKALLEQAKNKMGNGGSVDPEEVEHILMKAQGIKEHHCKCHDKMGNGGGITDKKDWTVIYSKGGKRQIDNFKAKDKTEAYKEAEIRRQQYKLDSGWKMIELYESKYENGGLIIVKGRDTKGRPFYEEFDSYEDALQQMEGTDYSHLDRESIRYYDTKGKMINEQFENGGLIIVKGRDTKGRPFYEEFDSYEDALQQMEGTDYSHLDRESIRYYDTKGKMINEQFENGGGVYSNREWEAIGITLDGKKFRHRILLGKSSNENDVKNALRRRHDLNIREITSIKEVLANGGRLKESDVQVGNKYELMNGETIEIKRFFVENGDENWVVFTRSSAPDQMFENSLNGLKNFINNWRKKMATGGAIEMDSWVQERKGNARGQVYHKDGEFVKLKDKYGNESNTLFHTRDLKMSSRPRYEQGGVVGQEITFDFQGENKKGVIKDITDSGDYIVLTNDGRTLLAEKDLDVISLGGMRKKTPMEKKRFGFFETGGSMFDQDM